MARRDCQDSAVDAICQKLAARATHCTVSRKNRPGSLSNVKLRVLLVISSMPMGNVEWNPIFLLIEPNYVFDFEGRCTAANCCPSTPFLTNIVTMYNLTYHHFSYYEFSTNPRITINIRDNGKSIAKSPRPKQCRAIYCLSPNA